MKVVGAPYEETRAATILACFQRTAQKKRAVCSSFTFNRLSKRRKDEGGRKARRRFTYSTAIPPVSRLSPEVNHLPIILCEHVSSFSRHSDSVDVLFSSSLRNVTCKNKNFPSSFPHTIRDSQSAILSRSRPSHAEHSFLVSRLCASPRRKRARTHAVDGKDWERSFRRS